ncbi:MAG: hypothetical protein AB2556_23460 [Candidatus Thiodiazotropha sp.]
MLWQSSSIHWCFLAFFLSLSETIFVTPQTRAQTAPFTCSPKPVPISPMVERTPALQPASMKLVAAGRVPSYSMAFTARWYFL